MTTPLQIRTLLLGSLLVSGLTASATNPVLTFRGTVATGDNTAFIDQVEILSGATGTNVVANAVTNASFEDTDPLARDTYGYVPTGAFWNFGNGSGIANTGAGFNPTNIPNGNKVAFLQGTSQFQQTLTLAAGAYRVQFQAAQRTYSPTNVQQIQVLINGTLVNATAFQPGSTAYTTFTTDAFTVAASTPFALAGQAPTRNQLGVARTGYVTQTFTEPVNAASANNASIFSSQFGGLLKTKQPLTISGNQVTYVPNRFFKAGEQISVTLPNTVVSNALGQATNKAQVYQFTVATQNNGAGNGTFSGTQNPTVGTNPRGTTMADVDGDGRLDLIAASSISVSVFLNTGNSGSPAAPTFAPRAVLLLPNGATAFGVAVGDVDGDGRLDIVTANAGPNNVSVFRNTGTATGTVSFTDRREYPVGNTPEAIALGDVDADGDLDIVTANFNGDNVTVLQNVMLSAGTQAANFLPVSAALTSTSFTTGAILTCGSNSEPEGVVIGDFDNDGLPDVAVSSIRQDRVSIFRNLTELPGNLAFATRTDITVGTKPFGLAAADINGDGKLDIVTANRDANTVTVLQNTSTGAGSIATSRIDLAVGADPISVALGDVNGDGFLDIVVANYNNSNGQTVSTLLRNSTNTEFNAQAVTTYATANSGPRDIALGDLDGDGDLDFVVASQARDAISYRINGTTATALPLPVKLVSFVARCGGAGTVLTWRTATEKNSASFDVQRSADGKTFESIAVVKSFGNSASGGTYTTTDERAPAPAYYRLRIVDTDGTAAYSPVAQATCATLAATAAGLTLVPNPAQGQVQVLGVREAVQLLDLTGRVLRQQATAAGPLNLEGLAPGIYLVRSGKHTARLQVQ